MTPCHRTGQLATFSEREDTTLPAGNPMTTPTTYAAWVQAARALALLSTWLAGLDVSARRRTSVYPPSNILSHTVDKKCEGGS